MFNVSEKTYANGSDAINHNAIYGRYTRLNEALVHADHTTASHFYVAPELSQVDRVKICDFPSSAGRQRRIVPGTTVDFMIVKNGAPGNIAVHVIPPSGEADAKRSIAADVVELSTDNYLVHIPVLESGTYRVHIRFNDVELPLSPLTFKSGLPAVGN